MDWKTLYCPNRACRYYGVSFPDGPARIPPAGSSRRRPASFAGYRAIARGSCRLGVDRTGWRGLGSCRRTLLPAGWRGSRVGGSALRPSRALFGRGRLVVVIEMVDDRARHDGQKHGDSEVFHGWFPNRSHEMMVSPRSVGTVFGSRIRPTTGQASMVFRRATGLAFRVPALARVAWPHDRTRRFPSDQGALPLGRPQRATTQSAKGHKSLARRKPRRPPADPGANPSRKADRTPSGPPLQPPPRTTRRAQNSPDAPSHEVPSAGTDLSVSA